VLLCHVGADVPLCPRERRRAAVPTWAPTCCCASVESTLTMYRKVGAARAD
jgi:hypothetical protein